MLSMNTATVGWVVLCLIIIAGLALAYFYGVPAAPSTVPPGQPAAATTTSLTLAGGTVSLAYPGGTYALAVAGEPLSVHSYIPPCDSPFDYCIYRVGTDYASTTFESTGIRISRRGDLTSQSSCLSQSPAGYASSSPVTVSNPGYAAAVFGPLGNAATGHYATGDLYRLWAGGGCTEFETRIGESQYANYPPGTIGQFTSADRTAVADELSGILGSVKVGSTTVAWPMAPASAKG